MIIVDIPFNPKRDKTFVSQTGFIDLKSAMVNNAIPSEVAETEENYNGIEDPASILGKPTDVFEAMDMQAHINSFTPPSGDDEPKV